MENNLEKNHKEKIDQLEILHKSEVDQLKNRLKITNESSSHYWTRSYREKNV